MNILLLGSTGNLGGAVLNRLLNDNHMVFALARNPKKLKHFNQDNLKIITGDIYSTQTYFELIKNCDVVISTIGPSSSFKKTTLFSDTIPLLIEGVKLNNPNAVLFVTSSGGVQKDDPEIQNSFWYKHIGMRLLKSLYTDMKKMEDLLDQEHELNWVCIRPTYIRGNKTNNPYRVADKYCPKGGWQISKYDLADFIAKEVLNKKFIGKKPVIAY
jgi:putative NADH-flavin reductase